MLFRSCISRIASTSLCAHVISLLHCVSVALSILQAVILHCLRHVASAWSVCTSNTATCKRHVHMQPRRRKCVMPPRLCGLQVSLPLFCHTFLPHTHRRKHWWRLRWTLRRLRCGAHSTRAPHVCRARLVRVYVRCSGDFGCRPFEDDQVEVMDTKRMT